MAEIHQNPTWRVDESGEIVPRYDSPGNRPIYPNDSYRTRRESLEATHDAFVVDERFAVASIRASLTKGEHTAPVTPRRGSALVDYTRGRERILGRE